MESGKLILVNGDSRFSTSVLELAERVLHAYGIDFTEDRGRIRVSSNDFGNAVECLDEGNFDYDVID